MTEAKHAPGPKPDVVVTVRLPWRLYDRVAYTAGNDQVSVEEFVAQSLDAYSHGWHCEACSTFLGLGDDVGFDAEGEHAMCRSCATISDAIGCVQESVEAEAAIAKAKGETE